ncbi:hypothetical protein Jiend_44830 [Micromonospora endophytica]|nr:hypothetical protein Jiend_44830 [Micromonospora endophytica]
MEYRRNSDSTKDLNVRIDRITCGCGTVGAVAVTESAPLPSFRSHSVPGRATSPVSEGAQRDHFRRGDIAVSERTRADHRGAAVSGKWDRRVVADQPSAGDSDRSGG